MTRREPRVTRPGLAFKPCPETGVQSSAASASSWLHERTERPHADRLRFDAIGVTFDLGGRLVALEHLEGAF